MRHSVVNFTSGVAVPISLWIMTENTFSKVRASGIFSLPVVRYYVFNHVRPVILNYDLY